VYYWPILLPFATLNNVICYIVLFHLFWLNTALLFIFVRFYIFFITPLLSFQNYWLYLFSLLALFLRLICTTFKTTNNILFSLPFYQSFILLLFNLLYLKCWLLLPSDYLQFQCLVLFAYFVFFAVLLVIILFAVLIPCICWLY
jgi:hypothetical protein